MAVPTLAEKRHPTILRHDQCQHRLLHIRPVILGRAVGDRHGLSVRLRHLRPCEGKTGGVQTVELQRNPFLLAHRQRDLAEQRVTAVGEAFVEAPPQLEAVAMLRGDAFAKEQGNRLVREKLWGQGEGAI